MPMMVVTLTFRSFDDIVSAVHSGSNNQVLSKSYITDGILPIYAYIPLPLEKCAILGYLSRVITIAVNRLEEISIRLKSI